MVGQALAERGVGRVDAAFVGWAKEIRHLVVCLPCKARLRPPCTLRTQAHTQGGLTTKQMAGPEAQELIAAMGGVRILVQMCSVPQPEEVRAIALLSCSLPFAPPPRCLARHCASDFAVHRCIDIARDPTVSAGSR